MSQKVVGLTVKGCRVDPTDNTNVVGSLSGICRVLQIRENTTNLLLNTLFIIPRISYLVGLSGRARVREGKALKLGISGHFSGRGLPDTRQPDKVGFGVSKGVTNHGR